MSSFTTDTISFSVYQIVHGVFEERVATYNDLIIHFNRNVDANEEENADEYIEYLLVLSETDIQECKNIIANMIDKDAASLNRAPKSAQIMR